MPTPQRKAWEGSTRRARLPKDWRKRRAARLALDGHRCTATMRDGSRCPEPATEVDHHQRGDDHSMGNLRSLCSPHHRAKTQREANAARPSRRRPPEPHPGLLPGPARGGGWPSPGGALRHRAT